MRAPSVVDLQGSGTRRDPYDEPMTCPSCGAEVPPGARFCASCGHAVVARPDERRVVTVLFADLVGFTSLSEAADPEKVKNLVDRCFERLADDVVAFGGQVDKVVGDALVALFGAPVAHEDDAERAVRAALRMQETLATLRDDRAMAVEMRVGINTGEVLVGALRAGGDYTAMGDVVNTASRLQAGAAPGSVVVGPATHAATERSVGYEPLGPLSVKGRDEPVLAWRALEVIAPPGRHRAAPTAPLVGRTSELAVLAAALRTAARRARAHLVLITGEAGVGKTRLARELGDLAATEHGALVLAGHCVPYGEANVWWPLALALGEVCGIDLADSNDVARVRVEETVRATLGLDADDPELDRVTEGLLYVMGRVGPAPGADPARARDDAYRSLTEVFAALTRRQPLVLVLSDLHWADDAVLDPLPRLLARLATRPFVLAATGRPELTERFAPPPGRHNTVVVNLDPLDPVDTEELLRALLGPQADDDLVALLRERSGGNPFFVEELVAMVNERSASPAAHLPATLHGLVAARLDMLDPAARALLQDAAVVGPTGPVELVLTLAETRGEPSPADTLARLVDQDLLVVGDGVFEFRNAVLREVAYGTLAKAERARRHAELARSLAEVSEARGRLDEALDRLAFHFKVAAELRNELGPITGVPDDLVPRAARFLLRAASRAEEREDFRNAERLLSHAVHLVEGDPERRLQAHTARARARAELHDAVGAREDMQVAQALATALGDERSEARLLVVLGDVQYKEGDLASASRTLDDAVTRWRGLDDAAGLGHALRVRGMTALFSGELDRASACVGEALDLYRSIADRRGEAWALQNLAWIAFVRGRHDEAETRLDESVKAFAEARDWGGVGWALGLLAYVRFAQGRIDEAGRLARQVHEEATELGDAWAAAMMQVLLANLSLWQGELFHAVDLAREAYDALVALGDGWGQVQALAPLVFANNLLGNRHEAKDHLQRIQEAVASTTDPWLHDMAGLMRLVLAVQVGDADAPALAEAATLSLDERAQRFVNEEHRNARMLAMLQSGDVGGAVAVLDALAEEPLGNEAATRVVRALVLVAAGRLDEAAEACEQAKDGAVSYADRYRALLARAFTRLRLGDAVAARADVEQAERIVEATDARLDRLVVMLAHAAMDRVTGDPGPASARARSEAAALGLRPSGWERLFAELAGAAA